MATENDFSPVMHGMRLGAKVSLIVANIYFIICTLIEVGRQIWLTHDQTVITLPFVKVAGFLPFYFLCLIYPVVVLGSLTGGIIGEFWACIGHRLGSRIFPLIALAFCLSVVVGFHLIFRIHVDFSIPTLQLDSNGFYMDSLGLLVSYPFLLGIPSILYILIGGLGSYFFWSFGKIKINETEKI